MPHPPTPDWSNFLNLDLPAADPLRLRAAFSGKSILITGAGGWIGSALAASLLAFNPRQIVLLDSAESNLYEVYSALSEKPGQRITPILGSVCDPSLLRELFHQFRPHIIFHAAAFKHVPLMEQNPIAVVQNNSIGTYTLAEAASEFSVEQLILISTDKAADPVSIMGASKRVAELVLLAGIAESAQQKVVRLGNVLGSPGSVVPLFLKQIACGGPLTVTHPNARRYFVTLQQTVQFLLSALLIPGNQDQYILVPQLADQVPIVDLARFLIAGRNIPIAFTQLRPGEKLAESLLARRESYASFEAFSLRSVQTPAITAADLEPLIKALQQAIAQRDLPNLLHTLQRIVPEYEPSGLLLQAASALSVERQ